jgi:hypothetical protein
MSAPYTKRVISVCNRQHLDVWRLTSALLPFYVQADDYVVYVPSKEIQEFKQATNDRIRVLSENHDLDVPYVEELREKISDAGNSSRFGWYLQQFIKIQALIQSDTDVSILWDADAVPVRKIDFFNSTGVPNYLRASEFNSEYFEMIDRLLGLSKVQTQSFVTPGFPVFTKWVNELVYAIEQQHGGEKWFDAVLNTVNFSHQSGFSEFELLGTWIANSYPDSWNSIDLEWERLGQSRFNYARKLSPSDLIEIGRKHNLDIISFENWDLRGIRGRVSFLATLCQRFLPKQVTSNSRCA